MGINKVILLGNLGRDPELRYTPGGTAVAAFTLATTERYTDKNGQKQERTEWHNIVVWGKLAELVNQYLKKGRTVYIEGRITNRSWDDRDGNKKYRTEIIATTVEFIGSSAHENGSATAAQGIEAVPSDSMLNDSAPEFMPKGSASEPNDLPF